MLLRMQGYLFPKLTICPCNQLAGAKRFTYGLFFPPLEKWGGGGGGGGYYYYYYCYYFTYTKGNFVQSFSL